MIGKVHIVEIDHYLIYTTDEMKPLALVKACNLKEALVNAEIRENARRRQRAVSYAKHLLKGLSNLSS